MNKLDKMGIYTRNGEDVVFNYTTSPCANDKVRFVKFVTDSLVDEDYNYILKDMIFDFGFIYIFSDIDVEYIFSDECMDSIGIIEDMLDETNIVDIIKANIDSKLIEELNRAVDYNIEYKTGVHKNVIADSLSNLLDTVERKISNIDIDGMMEMAQAMSGVSEELTADKILEAYSKSDMYKRQHKQLVEKRKRNNVEPDEFNVVKGRANDSSPLVSSPTYEA